LAKVLVAVALSDEEAEALERAAVRRGESIEEALEEALRLYLEVAGGGGANTSLQALYSSRRASHRLGSVSP
jgi:hypothetical protein